MKKNIEMSLEQARTYYKESNDMSFKNMLEENFGKENLIEFNWESLEEITGYYINGDSAISSEETYLIHSYHRNIFATENQAKSCLAMSQISQLMRYYNGDWVPDWKNKSEEKYSINYNGNDESLKVVFNTYAKYFITFRTREIAEKFLKNHEHLIREYYNY